jgi:phage gpG-like protein
MATFTVNPVGDKSSIEAQGLNEVLRDLKAIVANAKDLTPINFAAAHFIRGKQIEHFRLQRDSKGASWAPLSKLTLALRRGNGGGKPLQDTGRMRASINILHYSSRDVEVGIRGGTEGKKAVVHQHGATIKPKKGNRLFIPVNKAGARARSFRTAKGMIALKQAVIPAREFIYLTDQDMVELTETYASEIATRGTFYIDWRRVRRFKAVA